VNRDRGLHAPQFVPPLCAADINCINTSALSVAEAADVHNISAGELLTKCKTFLRAGGKESVQQLADGAYCFGVLEGVAGYGVSLSKAQGSSGYGLCFTQATKTEVMAQVFVDWAEKKRSAVEFVGVLRRDHRVA
jgi:hypothetical protein